MKGMKLVFLPILFLSFHGMAQKDSSYYVPDYLEVEEITRDLKIPWDMEWSNDGFIWFTERDGNINRLDPVTGVVENILWVEETFQSPENSGMHAFALHPDFPDVPYVFVHYSYHLYISRIERYTWYADGDSLGDRLQLIKLGANSSHNGSRIVFESDNTFFFALGDAYTRDQFPQDLEANNGKILRLNIDGTFPANNPLDSSAIWSFGHRNPQGLCLGPTGLLYNSEHGPEANDEVNLIQKFNNYGWPHVQGYCDTEEEKAFCDTVRTTEPMRVWTPTEAVAGMTCYNHDAIPEWKNCLLLTTLKDEQLKVLPLSDDGREITNEANIFCKQFGRLRDVLVAPDGSVYLCTTNREITGWGKAQPNDDKIIRIYNPAKHAPLLKSRPLALDIHLDAIVHSDSVYVKCYGAGTFMKVMNESGQVIIEQEIDEVGFSLKSEDLGPGSYIILFERDGESMTKRVVLY